MAICKFCEEDRELLNSHAIPNSIFKRIFRQDSGKATVITADSNTPTYFSSDSWKEKMLCPDCEQFFNSKYEKYSLEIIRGAVYHDKGVTFKDLEATKLVGFCISIFWRAANSSHQSYDKVLIPETWNEQIRTCLFDGQFVSRKYVCVKINRLIDRTPKGFSLEELRSIVMSPIFRRYGYGRYSFLFLLEGFLVEIFMPGLKYKEKDRKSTINKNQKILLVPYIDVFDVPELKECMILGYGKIRNEAK